MPSFSMGPRSSPRSDKLPACRPPVPTFLRALAAGRYLGRFCIHVIYVTFFVRPRHPPSSILQIPPSFSARQSYPCVSVLIRVHSVRPTFVRPSSVFNFNPCFIRGENPSGPLVISLEPASQRGSIRG